MMLVPVLVLGSVVGCDVIHVPVVSVSLTSSSPTITGPTPVQFLATVTEDGAALQGVEVLFSASRGTFSGGSATETTVSDSVGLAVAALTLSDLTDTTPVEVTATAVEANVMTMVSVNVQPGGTR